MIGARSDANVVVTFARSELEANANPEILVNGYDKETITSGLKAKLINAVTRICCCVHSVEDVFELAGKSDGY